MSSNRPTEGEIVLPLAAETIEIGRRVVETGRVTVSTVTSERTETVDVVLSTTRVRVDRVPVGRFVDAIPATRTEGDIVIMPVVEEVVVKRLFLREEVRLVPEVTTRNHQETVPLRVQEVVVLRSARTDATGAEATSQSSPPPTGGQDAE